ncbi:MAG: class I tRNA ligase family protein, partial [bacterium]
MAEGKYDHKQIEPKWQKYWEENQTFRAIDGDKRPKFYALDMFAYPSGEGLHAGHPRSYTATDIFARYYRMKGCNVLRPIGWDAFGLPAENYAIQIGKPPTETTQANVVRFTQQVKSFGFAYDWDREVNTANPSYYKWTQWVFKVLYDNGLAYQREAYANWCSKDQTVLANEQVVNGCCERCGTQVEQKKLKQWFFKITDFAEDLIDGLEKIDWPQSTKIAQKNWIGKSEGATVKFSLSPCHP